MVAYFELQSQWLHFTTALEDQQHYKAYQQALREGVAIQLKYVKALFFGPPQTGPGVAETLDWASALQVLGAEVLSPEAASDTLGVILKYEDDIERVRAGGVGRLTAED